MYTIETEQRKGRFWPKTLQIDVNTCNHQPYDPDKSAVGNDRIPIGGFFPRTSIKNVWSKCVHDQKSSLICEPSMIPLNTKSTQ